MIRRRTLVLVAVLTVAASSCADDTKSIATTGGGHELAASLGCMACHSVDGTKKVGPTWSGLAGSVVTLSDGSQITADRTYLEESVRAPKSKIVTGYPDVMPKVDMSDSQRSVILDYIESLGEDQSATSTTAR